MPGWLLYTIGVAIFAIALLLSIALHEIGHMVPAKRFGVKVTQYMVGFGPTIWSRKRGDTEYGIKGIPLGGYIRMIGMVPPREDGTRSRWPRRMATAVEEYRQLNRADIDPQDEAREFYRLTPGKKMIVMLGGPSMNLLIYVILTVILLTTVGVAHSDPTTTVGSIVKCVVPAKSTFANAGSCPKNYTAPPAAGKLHGGDQIVAINGTAITSWDQMVRIVQASAGKSLQVTVLRKGVRVTTAIVPTHNLNYAAGSTTKLIDAGFLGIAPTDHNYLKPLAVSAVPGQIGSQVRQGWDRLMSYPSRISNLFGTVFEGKKRDPEGAIGIVGISRISGDVASSNQLGGEAKIATLISLIASVNLILFFINLLPVLPLDGGHVAGAMFEALRRGRQRLRRTGAPRRQIFVDTAQLVPVAYVVASLLIVLTVLTLYADVVDPINPFSG